MASTQRHEIARQPDCTAGTQPCTPCNDTDHMPQREADPRGRTGGHVAGDDKTVTAGSPHGKADPHDPAHGHATTDTPHAKADPRGRTSGHVAGDDKTVTTSSPHGKADPHDHPHGHATTHTPHGKADPRGRTGGHVAGDDHAGHSHAIGAGADRRYLWTAFGLIVAFMAVEVVVGLVAGSLVLLADAAHMVSDAAAIGLALFAMRLAARPATGAYTFGLKRAEILSAMANGATLLALGLFFVVEGIGRLFHPPAVPGGAVLAVALAGMAVNLAATLVLRRANRRSLNVEGSFRHILTDLYAFIGTAIAGVVIMTTGFARADAIASLLVAALMIKAGVELVRESGRVVLEAAPRGIDPASVRTAILGMPGVLGVHELHIWEVTSGFPALSAHVTVDGHRDCHERRAELEHLLATTFDIRHTTLQVDHPKANAYRHVDDPECPSAE